MVCSSVASRGPVVVPGHKFNVQLVKSLWFFSSRIELHIQVQAQSRFSVGFNLGRKVK